jgi:hypothetical protein
MASAVDICNSALAKVGTARITSLDNNSEEARLCKELYPKLKLELLRSHPWNFAINRVELAEIGTDPIFEFDSQFQLPDNCIRVLGIDSTENYKNIKWKIEGRKILISGITTLKIKFIDSDVVEDDFDESFKEALAFRIASDLAYPLTQSISLSDNLYQKYERSLAMARTYDAQEGSSDRFVADDWLDARF